MTIQELNTRQGWTLSQKIDHAVGTVEAFLSRTGKVPYVSFSGGKDSTVLLDIVRRFVDRDIKAVFCNTGNEYPEIVRFVRSTENVTIIRPGSMVFRLYRKNRRTAYAKRKRPKAKNYLLFAFTEQTQRAGTQVGRLPTVGSI